MPREVHPPASQPGPGGDYPFFIGHTSGKYVYYYKPPTDPTKKAYADGCTGDAGFCVDFFLGPGWREGVGGGLESTTIQLVLCECFLSCLTPLCPRVRIFLPLFLVAWQPQTLDWVGLHQALTLPQHPHCGRVFDPTQQLSQPYPFHSPQPTPHFKTATRSILLRLRLFVLCAH